MTLQERNEDEAACRRGIDKDTPYEHRPAHPKAPSPKNPLMETSGGASTHCAYNLHCSSFFWFNQFYIQDPKRYPQKGTTMETIGAVMVARGEYVWRITGFSWLRAWKPHWYALILLGLNPKP